MAASAGVRFVVVALALATVAAVAANLVLRGVGRPVEGTDWTVSIGTALVVGAFLSLLFVGRKGASDEPSGGHAPPRSDAFDVKAVKEESDVGDGPRPAGRGPGPRAPP